MRLLTATTLTALLLMLSACSPSGDQETSKAKAENTPAATAVAIIDDYPYAFEQVTTNAWVMHGPREFPTPENKGFMNNPAVIKTSEGLVIVDPGSTVHVGNNVLKKVKKISDQPIVAVFNTHIHGDHWLANQAIMDAYPEVKIYGHPEMLAEIEAGEGENWVEMMATLTEGASKGTIVVAPTTPIDHGDVITVGDTSFKIHHYGVSHTKTDIMIEVPELSLVFLGDNVLALRLPRTSDGTFQGNINAINKILETQSNTYVPGHGPTGNRAMVEDYLNYLTVVYAAAQKAFEADLDSSDVIGITSKTASAYADWAGYDELIGPHGAQAYAEVEEAEF
jgi:glyoxylase-like metal-dependent hydrolase (beta-lactamase superfamily II)